MRKGVANIVQANPGFYKSVPVYDNGQVTELINIPIIAWVIFAHPPSGAGFLTVTHPVTLEDGHYENYFILSPDGTYEANDGVHEDGGSGALLYAQTHWKKPQMEPRK